MTSEGGLRGSAERNERGGLRGSAERTPQAAGRGDAARLFVGTYTEGTASEGIYTLACDAKAGRLAVDRMTRTLANPSFLVPWGTLVCAAHELPDRGCMATYAVRADGSLALVDARATSDDAGTCFVAVHPAGRALYGANYQSGSVGCCPLGRDGSLGAPFPSVHHGGHGANPERQEAPHVHTLGFVPGTSQLVAVDLGIDALTRYRTMETGALALPPLAVERVPAGSGPRIMAYHPRLPLAAVVDELANDVLDAPRPLGPARPDGRRRRATGNRSDSAVGSGGDSAGGGRRTADTRRPSDGAGRRRIRSRRTLASPPHEPGRARRLRAGRAAPVRFRARRRPDGGLRPGPGGARHQALGLSFGWPRATPLLALPFRRAAGGGQPGQRNRGPLPAGQQRRARRSGARRGAAGLLRRLGASDLKPHACEDDAGRHAHARRGHAPETMSCRARGRSGRTRFVTPRSHPLRTSAE